MGHGAECHRGQRQTPAGRGESPGTPQSPAGGGHPPNGLRWRRAQGSASSSHSPPRRVEPPLRGQSCQSAAGASTGDTQDPLEGP